MLDTIIPFPLSILLLLAGYIVLGIGLSRLARAAGCPYPRLAWVPFGRLYLLGHVADIYTDNRITPAAIRFHSSFRPSDVRRRLLGLGIGYAAVSVVATVGQGMKLVAKVASFFSLLGSLADGFPTDIASFRDSIESSLEASPVIQHLSAVGSVIYIVAGIVSLILIILFLTVLCPVLYRLFKAMDIPVPALLTAVSVFFPLLTAILLFFYTRHPEGLGERFVRPPRESEAPNSETI